MRGPNETIAEQAVNEASRSLRGREVRGLSGCVESVFWYGAVDIDPCHCVVWVLVSGPESERLPPWLFLGSAGQVPEGAVVSPDLAALGVTGWNGRPLSTEGTTLSADLAAWLAEAAAEVRRAFADAGWGDREPPRVGFESHERVAREGGWNYFR